MSLPSSVIPDSEPILIMANRSAQWTKSLSDFPAGTWRLNYELTTPAGAALTLAWATEVTAAGTNFSIKCPASKTAAVAAAGGGRLVGTVVEAADTTNDFVIYDKPLEWRTSSGLSLAAQTLAAIDAMMLGNASREERQIGASFPSGLSKQLMLCSKEELLSLRSYYATLVANEQAAQGTSSRLIRSRFTSPR